MMKSWMNFISFCFVLLCLPGISNFFYCSLYYLNKKKNTNFGFYQRKTQSLCQQGSLTSEWRIMQKTSHNVIIRSWTYSLDTVEAERRNSLLRQLTPPSINILQYCDYALTIRSLLLLLLSYFRHVRLCATPQTAAHQAPLSLGFSRQECWSGLPFPSPMHESEN